ncbi:MAG: YdcF family protein [Acidobacteriota bacterium]
MRSRALRWLIPLSLLVILAAAHPLWLGGAGNLLVQAEQPSQAEIIIVLAGGGYHGNRLLAAADLVRAGFAPRILVSGPDSLYGLYESDLAIPFAVKKGYPREWFVPLANQARSTEEEARDIVAELRRRGLRRFLVVTSDYHTRRAHRIYRRAAPEMEFRTVAVPDPDFPSGGWWRTRQGQKTFFLEWTKTLAWWLGL